MVAVDRVFVICRITNSLNIFFISILSLSLFFSFPPYTGNLADVKNLFLRLGRLGLDPLLRVERRLGYQRLALGLLALLGGLGRGLRADLLRRGLLLLRGRGGDVYLGALVVTGGGGGDGLVELLVGFVVLELGAVDVGVPAEAFLHGPVVVVVSGSGISCKRQIGRK